MQAASGSVSWVAAQPFVLGRCGRGGGGGGTSSGAARGTARGGGVGGRAVGMARCCARAQEKRPPRVRKTKEERRELVESFINKYVLRLMSRSISLALCPSRYYVASSVCFLCIVQWSYFSCLELYASAGHYVSMI
jgi:hypothetical protein